MNDGTVHRQYRGQMEIIGAIAVALWISACATVKCPAEERAQSVGALLQVQEFTQLGDILTASASWKTRIERADTGLLQLASGFLPCRELPFDPYDTRSFCKRLEVEIPLLRESVEHLRAEVRALEGEIAARRGRGQDQIEHDFQIRLYNFQNLLRRTDTVVMIYLQSSVMD